MIRSTHHNEIFIDREGVWYFCGSEMKRKDIVQYLYKYLKRDLDGNYLIEIEDDRCNVRVEDTPFIIRRVAVGFSRNSRQLYIDLSLNDGSSEGLNLDAPLRIAKANVMYCKVKKGEHEARFSRPAYYQLCEHIEYDSQRGEYRLVLNHISYPLVLIDEGIQ
jgi:hypothetical protein